MEVYIIRMVARAVLANFYVKTYEYLVKIYRVQPCYGDGGPVCPLLVNTGQKRGSY